MKLPGFIFISSFPKFCLNRKQVASLREKFGQFIAHGVAEMGLNSPQRCPIYYLIQSSVTKIFQLLETRLPVVMSVERLVNQSTNVLNVLYTARKKFDPLYVYWLLPLQFALSSDDPGATNKDEKNSLMVEGVQVYTLAMHLDLLTRLGHRTFEHPVRLGMSKDKRFKLRVEHVLAQPPNARKVSSTKRAQQDGTEDSPNQSEFEQQKLEHVHEVVADWLEKLFVGTLRFSVVLFLWDQWFMHKFDFSVMERMAHTVINMLNDILQEAETMAEVDEILQNGPCRTLTLDVIRGWRQGTDVQLANEISQTSSKNRLGRIIRTQVMVIRATTERVQPTPIYFPGFCVHGIVLVIISPLEWHQRSDNIRITLDHFILDQLLTTCSTQSVPQFYFAGSMTTTPFESDLSGIDRNPELPHPQQNIMVIHFPEENELLFPEHEMTNLPSTDDSQLDPSKMSQLRVKVEFNIDTNSNEFANEVDEGRKTSVTCSELPLNRLKCCLRAYVFEFQNGFHLDGPLLQVFRFLWRKASLQTNHLVDITFIPYYSIQQRHRELRTCQWNRCAGSRNSHFYFFKTNQHISLAQTGVSDDQCEPTKFQIKIQLSPPPTPIDDPWVEYAKPSLDEQLLKRSTNHDPFCIYVDQLRFMPDNCTVFKVTGRLLNTGFDSDLLDLLALPEMVWGLKTNPSSFGLRRDPTAGSNVRSPLFVSDQRSIVNLTGQKHLANSSLLFLRVYTILKTNMKPCIVGNAILRVFDDKGGLNFGGHQLRLRCQVPRADETNNGTPFYDALSLEQSAFIPCASILFRLLPYTKEPISMPLYRGRSYQSIDCKPTALEWRIYRLFQSDTDDSLTFRRMVRDLLTRENNSDKRISLNQSAQLNQEYMRSFVLQRLSPIRTLGNISVPTQMRSIFPFRYRVKAGFQIHLYQAAGLPVSRGDFVFGLGKVIRGELTKRMSPNKLYAYGTDDDLLFSLGMDLQSSMSNPKWNETASMITRPYPDPAALLVMQLFRMPLGFEAPGSIYVAKTTGGWFAQKTDGVRTKAKRNNEAASLNKQHLLGWSVMHLLEWGFLKEGKHTLALWAPPIRSSWIKTTQENCDRLPDISQLTPLPDGNIILQLKDGNFLEERESLAGTDIQMNEGFQPDEDNFPEPIIGSPVKAYGASLFELAAHRKKTDGTWLPGSSEQEAAEKLLDEIHGLITSELKKIRTREEYRPLFLSSS
ncbi:hypothetical protein D915_001165 [Fasciola hepatica]|uniref:Uncharacterized protein n=1 Tax=Fasciola hepatica TaxID=6192 RepID=A0A4E0RMH7_FASHE|nr:hypothetical protein D915_001165 [Fasciola hepatica]